MNGLISLMQSRKFWVTLLGFIGASVAYSRHEIDANLWVTSIIAFVLVLVSSIAAEDVAKHSATKRNE